MNLAPGELGQLFVVKCHECKRETVLHGPVTKHGAVRMAENIDYARHPVRGWLCRECRSTPVTRS